MKKEHEIITFPGKTEEVAPGTARPPEFSEGAVSLLFVERHAGDLRYVKEWNKWFHWCGTHWVTEKTALAFDSAKMLCFEQSARCNHKHTPTVLASAKFRAAVVSMAQEHRCIVATADQWDKDAWLLNTPGGVVDLRTGELRPHKCDDYMTMIR